MASTRALFDMASPDLEDHLHSTEQELMNVRFQYATRQVENYSRIRQLKREIARTKTILHERELADQL